jgi:ectoine hydroxylase-related dioxygenase (phytanoyl-CoA dioxygenase family)
MELHALNRGFQWRSPGAGRYLSRSQLDAYDRDGYFVLSNAIDPPTLARITEEVDTLDRMPAQRHFISRPDEINITANLVKSSMYLRQFVRSDLFAELLHDLIGPDVRLYWDQSVYKKPRSPSPFPWHQDNGYLFLEPQQHVTCWVALTDATEANGCIKLMPGLHKRGTFAHHTTPLGYVCFDEDPADCIAVPVGAGSVVVFSSLIPHATGPNVTDSTRKAYIIQFAPDGATGYLADGTGVRTTIPLQDPEFQFPILENGQRAISTDQP